MTKQAFDKIADGLKEAAELVGSDEWFDTAFRKIFDEEFPETACPATKAVEGTGTPRVEENRFSEEGA